MLDRPFDSTTRQRFRRGVSLAIARAVIALGVALVLMSAARCRSSDSRSSQASSAASEAADAGAKKSATALSPASPADTLEVRLAGSAQPAPKTGFNANWLAFPARDDRLLDSIRTFQPEIIRYPGGTVGDYWDWQAGWIDPTELPPKYQVWSERYERRSQDLGQLKAVTESLGAIPLFSLNMITSSVDAQLQMLEAARQIGLPVRYVELGNEYYFGEDDYRTVFPSAEAYATTSRSWHEEIRRAFPDARIGWIGTFTRPDLPSRRRDWNRRVIEYGTERDAVSLHPYLWLEKHLTKASNATQAYGTFVRQDIGEKRAQGFQHFPVDSVWVTEYNILGPGRSDVRDTWMHGLLIGAYSTFLLQESRLRVLLAHEMCGSSKDHRAVMTERWGGAYALTTFGAALRVFFRTLHNTSTVQRLQFGAFHEQAVEAEKAVLAGNVYGDSTAIIVNMRDNHQVLDLQRVWGNRAFRRSGITYSYPMESGVTANDLRRWTDQGQGTVGVPPFSLVKVSLIRTPSQRSLLDHSEGSLPGPSKPNR